MFNAMTSATPLLHSHSPLSPPSPFPLLTASPPDQRPDALAQHGLLDVALLAEVEHQDRHVVLHALGDRLGVHHPQVLPQDVLVAQLAVEHGVRVLLRIVAEDAVHAGGLQQDVGVEFQGPLGGRRVGGHERAARARRPG